MKAGLPTIPAPFLPLGDGTTILSRLSGQLQALGFAVAIAVGSQGYPFRAYQPRGAFFTAAYERAPIEAILAEIGVNPDDSPWTPERHAYAAEHGRLFAMPNPGWTNQHDSFCAVMDLLMDRWDRILLVCGDTIFASHLLPGIVALQIPFQFGMHYNHAIFLLDHDGARIYRDYTGPRRKRSATPAGWEGATRDYPDGSVGTGRLDMWGIRHCGWHTPPWNTLSEEEIERLWFDVDVPGDYEIAKERIRGGWYT